MTASGPLEDAVWTDLDRGGATVAVPVGSLEQHGPHLPLDTDTAIAAAVTGALPGVLAAPAIAYGASGEHEAFPGTVSLGADALDTVLVEYGRSACRWAGRVLFVNGHGGNGPALVKAVALLRYEGRDVAWVPCAVPGADAHAGRTETSLLLHLSPDRVRLSSAEPGNVEPLASLMPRLREGGMVAVSANGVLGDPTGATAAEGAHLFGALVEDVSKALARWEPGPDGRLT
ncbi:MULTISPECIES: mycofactocin biosynthesis peptidyl-dipeptidase MftE [Rhodococcus]|jgi:mycofactocin system creatininase family protein|uniref:Mycofactocin biosynthesis peptidyl-dipeptidase MftE n=1 Tax=Rhodococcus oxybenzonivorans TaxID=1990687 RepID=A0A2S2BY63_9NOCA|nr:MULTISPECIES: mycofactocin biosynthesis peptidyl-dipeptidase MftE [Rhodococcus]AWK73575.1 mycofactocin biosynthesis peptidyl-dipeptidase MftE [Rhodococcus oxybenzonivorans]MDV7245599.1 mycofactocin biosynthesis peptidyl-dipeptidase MftE [Rhodococcus oxybenzonivorans]MDV7264401.1 mycofactocin biosynthesis peptidyl-dipeptidase MftE [Rhodococcus oxybenzonivorans]MDV7277046.1 mycofactocin biosynthesis peptidyl-dipeptidase MftE [Rhodococcus oxybenzonivorans]MDV7336623.1 mycofactocin biosynthesis